MDLQLRGLFPYLSKELKADLMIQNVTGASGVLGYNRAFKATPDGYTLVGNNIPGMIITEMGQSGSAYKTKEFVDLRLRPRQRVLVTHPELYRDFDEFVKAAKTQSVRLEVRKGDHRSTWLDWSWRMPLASNLILFPSKAGRRVSRRLRASTLTRY